MDFWKARIDIQEKTLPKEKFELAKDDTNEMLEVIRREANENLVILSQSRSPTPVIGIPRWRKLLLLYKPMEGNRVSGYIGRGVYLLSLSPLLLYIYLPLYMVYLYFNEPKANRAADLYALFHSRQGRATWASLGILLVTILIEAGVIFNSARRERPPQRIKEIDRL